MTHVYKTTIALPPTAEKLQQTEHSGLMDTSPMAQTALLLNEVISPLFNVCQIRQHATANGVSWVAEGYDQSPPNTDLLNTLIQGIMQVRGLAETPTLTTETMAQTDWVSQNQKSFAPIVAGRFFIHDSTHTAPTPIHKIPLMVGAGNAFGTGGHGTTTGCLMALSDTAKTTTPTNALDIGTGTGILAMAMHKLWKTCPILATDIAPNAITVTTQNLKQNHCTQGRGHSTNGGITPLLANGMTHRQITQTAPYDLIIANILAPPLRQISTAVVKNTAHGGTVILSGLLHHQATNIKNRYQRLGLKFHHQYKIGDWTTLILKKP